MLQVTTTMMPAAAPIGSPLTLPVRIFCESLRTASPAAAKDTKNKSQCGSTLNQNKSSFVSLSYLVKTLLASQELKALLREHLLRLQGKLANPRGVHRHPSNEACRILPICGEQWLIYYLSIIHLSYIMKV